MAEVMKCCNEEGHQGHICVLKGLGLSDEIARLSSNPTHVCFTCGTEVNNPKNVCQPVALSETP
jgi:hypothetical protein